MLSVLISQQSPARPNPSDPTRQIAAMFERLRSDPLRLRAFLAEMPKGGDLHNHLGGAVYAETYLARAVNRGLCIDEQAHAIRPPPCSANTPRADVALATMPSLEADMIDSLSMRNFVPHPGDASGHDHFFAAFDKFRAAEQDPSVMLVEEARRAAAENISYLEIIWAPRLKEATAIGEKATWRTDDFTGDLTPIAAPVASLVARASEDTNEAESRMRAALGCATKTPEPGCQVIIRYQTYSLRTLPPQAVFAQMAFNFALVAKDPRFVGVNIVAPEDDRVALRDYTLHMRVLRFFHETHPKVPLSLHAGELAFGLVPPAELRFHIRQAVEIAGASRIGHGTDVMYETDPAGLLAEMAQRKVAVEINETSNAQILGVEGPQHPFGNYLSAGVPLVLSTDDEGIERTDLTQEYVRAAETWHLGYRELKALALNSIRYSFLPGAPLSDRALRPQAQSEKASLQWAVEQDFKAFEKRMLK